MGNESVSQGVRLQAHFPPPCWGRQPPAPGRGHCRKVTPAGTVSPLAHPQQGRTPPLACTPGQLPLSGTSFLFGSWTAQPPRRCPTEHIPVGCTSSKVPAQPCEPRGMMMMEAPSPHGAGDNPLPASLPRQAPLTGAHCECPSTRRPLCPSRSSSQRPARPGC